MIINVPTADEFVEHGLMFLNFAWDSLFELLTEFDDVNEYNQEMDSEEKSQYWKAAKKPLSIAHALAQQGAELVLKSRIAETSPYLLIKRPDSAWPKGCDKRGTAFADFRTVDAQDLVRIGNTVCDAKLPEQFITTFETFRKERNALFHTVDGRLGFAGKEIAAYIIQIVHLVRPHKWPAIRKEYLEDTPLSNAIGNDYVMNQLCEEMATTIDLLDYKMLLNFFRFNKKQRRYFCPSCYWDLNRDTDPPIPQTAQLLPNTPSSTHLYCFVCDKKIPVDRRDCNAPQCKGNVIDASEFGDNNCLTCFEIG